VPVKINSNGFRDGFHKREKSPGVLRVLGLGDSFMFGWGVDTEETFLKKLEVGLRSRIGRPVETINTGVPGWGLNQYYLFLKRTGIQLSPDVVVVAYFVDDLQGPVQDSIPRSTQYDGQLHVKGGSLHHSRLFNFLKSLSHLIREKNRVTRIGYLHDLDERRLELARRTNYMMTELSADETEKYSSMLTQHLQRLKSLISEGRSEMVIMYIPDISRLNHPEAQLINRELSKRCDDLSIPFIDMTPVFERSTNPSHYYLWPRDPHINRQGHAEMAAALERLICDRATLKVTCSAPATGIGRG
jgi:hypothetical protein